MTIRCLITNLDQFGDEEQGRGMSSYSHPQIRRDISIAPMPLLICEWFATRITVSKGRH